MWMKPQLYLPTVSALGLLVIGHCISTLIQEPVDKQWMALAGLALFTGSLTIKIPSAGSRLSVSETFVFASVLLFGTCAGTITIALEILIAVSGIRWKQTTDPLRVLFNVSSGALSIWIAGTAFYLVAGIPPLSIQHAELHTLVVPLAVLSSTHFILNSGFIAVAMSLQRRESALTIWRTNFAGLSINYYAGASLAALFVSYTKTIDFFALGVIVPLLLVSYLTFKSSLARIEDATKHVEEIKRLYLSTIETLATAIDAKDQVTHGHIRRVQQLALALAREIGVRDANQLQALEASALLHDTGKLAIPEHILNKPGKLTSGEFEKMKEHASVGAEILSSIQFPYPVVPIVRHHHENWDGSGYPDRLKGIEIPVGARILAVVDCFDALRSDRPYRPRMSDEDAIAILIQRRGSMYDPLVVDTFIANLPKLSAQISAAPESPPTPASRKLLLAPLPALSAQSAAVEGRIDLALDRVLRQTSASLAVLFVADRNEDRLVSRAARTASGDLRQELAIPLGYGVSGWVAANGTPVLNAEASLDFRSGPPLPKLVRSLCVPLRSNGGLAGVLSLYTDDPRGFNEEDRTCLEELSALLEKGEGAATIDGMLRATESQFKVAPRVH
jgi:putative nucleotidyltransferase with HDIG domain